MRRRGAVGLLLSVLTLCGCTTQPLAFEARTRLPAYAREEAARQIVVTIRETPPALATSAGVTPKAYGDAAPYRPSAYARRIAAAIGREYRLIPVAEWRIALLEVHCIVFRAADPAARSEALRRLQDDARVESVQPMQEFRTSGEVSAYNDPYFPLQKHVETLRVPEAHRWSQGRRVRVAVIDTGVDLEHPELRGRVRIARNFVDDDREAFRRDAHGTAVTGVIAAAVNNGLGIVGVAPGVEIFALKACWHGRPDEPAICNTLTLAEALAFALERGAAVINLSLTGPADPLLHRLVQAAVERGVIVVGAQTDAPRSSDAFPLGIAGVIAVANADALPAELLPARLAAPGREILTLAPSGRYDYLSGVSLSSAMVSGVAALLLERNRALTPAQVAALLERTASRGSGVPDTLRLVNACDAVASITQAASCPEAGPRVARAHR